MHIPAGPSRPRGENTIALINVVFLLLIFLLVAGTIAPADERSVILPGSERGVVEARQGNALVLRSDGTLLHLGEVVGLETFTARHDPQVRVRIAADRTAPAEALIALVADLRAAGLNDIAVMVDRSALVPVP